MYIHVHVASTCTFITTNVHVPVCLLHCPFQWYIVYIVYTYSFKVLYILCVVACVNCFQMLPTKNENIYTDECTHAFIYVQINAYV